MDKTTKILRISMIFLASAAFFSAVSNLIITAQENHIAAIVSQDKKVYSEAIMLRKNISQLALMQEAGPVMPDAVKESFESVKSTLEYFISVRPGSGAEIESIMKNALRLKDNAMSGKIYEGSWRVLGQADEFVGKTLKSVSGKSYKLPQWVFFISFFGRLVWAAFFAAFAAFMYFAISGMYKEGNFRNVIKENRVVSGLTRFINLVM